MGIKNQRLRLVCAASVALSLLSSCNSTQDIPGVQNFSFGVLKNHLYAGFTAETLHIDGGITAPLPIPGLEGAATLGINPALGTQGHVDEGTVFQLDVDLTKLKGKNFGLGGLPDGRPLPDIDGGELPRWTFSAKHVGVSLYLADGAFAVFIPINLVSPQGYALPTLLSQEIDDERGNMLGKVYAIPSQGTGTVSGLLVLVSFINPGISN